MKAIVAGLAVVAVQALVKSNYNAFMSLTDVYTKIDSLTTGSTFVPPTQVTVTNSTLKTTGGHSLTTIKVTDPTSPITEGDRGKVLVLAQHHVVGLIGASMACYILENVLDRNDEEMVNLLKTKVIYLIPIVNPDSYTLANLNTPSNTPFLKNQNLGGTSCVETGSPGINLDKNYGEWFATDVNPCNATYGGTAAFSETETQVVRNLMTTVGFDLVVSYDKTGNYYVLPSDQLSNSFSLSQDDSSFFTSFTQSTDYSLTGATTKTSDDVDKETPNGALLSWAYTGMHVFAVQARIGEDKLQATEIAGVLT